MTDTAAVVHEAAAGRLASHVLSGGMAQQRKRYLSRRAKEMPFIASMGIYVLKASAIKELLTQHFPTKHDFGSDIIPGAKDLGMKIQVTN
jgi:ADP-glucose pyrophosphorylase